MIVEVFSTLNDSMIIQFCEMHNVVLLFVHACVKIKREVLLVQLLQEN